MLRRRLPLLTLFAAVALSAPPAGAVPEINIDSYDIGAVTVNSNGVPTAQSLLAGSDVLSTNRTLLITNSEELSINAPTHTGQLFFEADSDLSTASTFEVKYDLLAVAAGGYDLTQGSTYDRFILEVLTNTLDGDLEISVKDINDVSQTAVFDIGTGLKEILYCGSFCGVVDLTKVKEILISGRSIGATDEIVQLGRLAIVPEPGTAALLTLGLLGLAAASPRKRIAA